MWQRIVLMIQKMLHKKKNGVTLNDSEAYRDSVLKVIIVLATGFIGWITTTQDTNPWTDTHIVIWLVLFVICGFLLWSIGARRRSLEATAESSKRQEEIKKQRENEQQEISQRLDEQDKKLTLFGKVMQAMARKDVIDMAERIIERGWTTSEERKAFFDLYSTYESLGIDGYIDVYVNKVNETPLKDLDKVIDRMGGMK